MAKKNEKSRKNKTRAENRVASFKPGIDVSSYQGDIDWATVAKSQKFVFIKATESSHFVDRRFAANWKSARAAGILRGAYHFFRPQVAVADQVANFVSTVGRLQSDDLAPVLDLEVPADWKNIEQSQRVKLALAWLEGVEEKLGVKPIVYLSPSFVRDVLGTANADALKGYTLWIANYTSANAPRVPAPWTDWTFWQYSETGKVPGINDGNVDLDWYNGSMSSLRENLSVGALRARAKKEKARRKKAEAEAAKADKAGKNKAEQTKKPKCKHKNKHKASVATKTCISSRT